MSHRWRGAVGGQGGAAWLATASADRSIVVWALASATQLVRTAGCHGLGVCALAWLPALVPGAGASQASQNALPTESVDTLTVSPIVASRIDP